MSNHRPDSNIHTTAFYGEHTHWPLLDEIHCERLQVRSAKHDWLIKPHRHINMLQCFYVQVGRGEALIDDRSLILEPGNLLVIPENCVHTFRWRSDSNGYVISITRPLLNRLSTRLGELPWSSGPSHCFTVDQDQAFIDPLFALMLDDYYQNLLQRELLLENLLQTLFIWLNRQHSQLQLQSATQSDKLNQRLQDFIRLLDQHHASQHHVEWYASQLGITAAHLNSVCKRLRQQTALSIIHQRIITEAQRILAYTNKPVAEVGELLGFGDPAYFSRFFKRATDTAPGAFRTAWKKDAVNERSDSVHVQLLPNILLRNTNEE